MESAVAVGLIVVGVWISPALALWALLVLPIASLPLVIIARRTRARSLAERRAGYVVFDVILQILRGIRIIKAYQGEEQEARTTVDERAALLRRADPHRAHPRAVQRRARIARRPQRRRGDHRRRPAGDARHARLAAVAGLSDRRAHAARPARPHQHRPDADPAPRRRRAAHRRAAARAAGGARGADCRSRCPARRAASPLDGVSFRYGDRAGPRRRLARAARRRDARHRRALGQRQDDAARPGRPLLRSERRRGALRRHRSARGAPARRLRRRSRWSRRSRFCSRPACGRTSAAGARAPPTPRSRRRRAAPASHAEIEALPQGYDTIVGVGGRGLSGGQAQRINVARAIIKNAPILLLDEATSNLDSIAELTVQRAIDRLQAGCTSLIVAHRLSTLRQADRILVLDHGRCVGLGTHDGAAARTARCTADVGGAAARRIAAAAGRRHRSASTRSRRSAGGGRRLAGLIGFAMTLGGARSWGEDQPGCAYRLARATRVGA